MDEDELARLIAKSSKYQKVGLITGGVEWCLALFNSGESKGPIAIAPWVAAMMIVGEYLENILPIKKQGHDERR